MSDRRRERWDLGDGAYMDISIDPDASAETVAALRQLGTAAAQRMRDESLTYDEAEIPERGTPFRLASRPPKTGAPTVRALWQRVLDRLTWCEERPPGAPWRGQCVLRRGHKGKHQTGAGFLFGASPVPEEGAAWDARPQQELVRHSAPLPGDICAACQEQVAWETRERTR